MSRPLQPKTAHMIVFDLREAARRYCPKALEVIAGCLDSADEKVRLMAANIMLERGYGKPEQKSDSTAVHKFAVAVVPEVMEEQEWLARRGQPKRLALAAPPERSFKDDDDPDRSLIEPLPPMPGNHTRRTS
jgi:hypothetical protein